ncbi:reelin-like [Lingula anatina]|uniref:Reelin n=1 Tax=Lingula anatina TaxID=7574 RepID=A0A2R2MTT2_LINAN|nr:reelin-like [Lingula anatina]|eukprot:XP_023933533.1 reelin-like [Lingula anatina]
MSHVQVLTLLLLTLQSCDSQGRLPFLSPFFFLCNYHRQQEAVGPEQGEVAISVSIEGNPQFYTPGQLYGVYIRSSSDFDGFLLTGLYTTASGAQVSPLTSPMAAISGSGGPHQGVNYMCSMIHSHLSRMPQQNLSFMWMAPPKGTGCVSFLATASLGQQVLFKDITAFQLCERGDVQSKPPRPKLTTIHSDGMVLREDFESGQEFDSVVWSSTIGGELSDKCGIVMYRNSAVFCHTDGDRVMVTNPLNTTTAVALQFALTPGSCRPSVEDEPINIYFASNDNCSDWTKIDKIRAPDLPYTVTHIIHLPTNAQKHGVCFKWQQARSEFTDSFGGCWAMDNVLISNTALTPTLLQEDFDPIDPSLWLFFPGSMIKMGCKSDGSAMIFGNEAGENMATTRDLDLSAAAISDIILEQTFEDSYLTGWHKEGSFAGHECGVIHEGKAMVFAHAGPRNLCTPYMDMTTVGSVRFYFAMGTEPCSFGNFTDGLEVLVYTEDKRGHTRTLDILPPQKFRKPKLVSLPLDLKSKKMKSRICWIQKKHGGLNNHIWSIDSIQLLPRLPSMPSHYVQFGLNMNCGTKSDGRVKLEFSTDRGDNWYLVHQPCLPGRCPGQHHTMSSVFKPFEFSGWQRVTVPLPYAALTSTTRLRWRQVGGLGQVHWGIDTVFIGPCSKGCGGHGYCKESGCICDFGYSGDTCEETTASHPTSLVEMLSPSADQVLPARFMSIQGATLSYACGVVASGKALVFNGDEMRKAETVDLNTTLSRYLQFSLRIGSDSPVSACLSPDRPEEAVILDVSCNGGIMWDTMKMFTASHYTTPRVEFIHLLSSAIGPSCRFRWWQPNHSGHKLDIWALDDISLTSKLYNTISLDIGKLDILDSGVKIHLGEIGSFCGKLNAVRFVKPEHQEEFRSITTNAVHIGPSHEVEFELVLGCGQRFSDTMDNSVVLEYSTDHGMNWNKVVGSCLPPQQCPQYQSDSKYTTSEFRQWKRVVVPLPAHTWSVTTMLRLHQAQWTPGDSWAVGHLYVGQQCPELCSGHGNCFEGVCRCDPGYSGETCQPIKPLKTHLREDFSRMGELHETWEVVLGGEVVPVKKGCGTILSGESLHFSQAGSRILSTHDMDTRRTDFLEFYLRIGGSNLLSCQGGMKRENSVLLQYSLNGGITWELLKDLQGDDYRNAKLVHVALPVSAKAAQVRYRWWQPYHGGLEQDQWALDQISLDTYTDMPLLYDDFERFNVYDSSHWLTVTEGMLFIYCQSASSALVLNNQDNPKFAITKRLKLAKGDVVQFKVRYDQCWLL